MAMPAIEADAAPNGTSRMAARGLANAIGRNASVANLGAQRASANVPVRDAGCLPSDGERGCQRSPYRTRDAQRFATSAADLQFVIASDQSSVIVCMRVLIRCRQAHLNQILMPHRGQPCTLAPAAGGGQNGRRSGRLGSGDCTANFRAGTDGDARHGAAMHGAGDQRWGTGP
jgi:hypothetical protein